MHSGSECVCACACMRVVRGGGGGRVDGGTTPACPAVQQTVLATLQESRGEFLSGGEGGMVKSFERKGPIKQGSDPLWPRPLG